MGESLNLQQVIEALVVREQKAKTHAAEFAARQAEIELETAEAAQKFQAECFARERKSWKRW